MLNQAPTANYDQTNKGLGIGNGLVDPEIQYQYYGAYARNNSYGIEFVSEVRRRSGSDVYTYICTP